MVVGCLGSAAAVGVVTGVVYLLRSFIPAVDLGVVYVLAVLAAAIAFGRAYAIGVSVASVILFNFLFLPPTLKLTLSGEENWLALGVYLVTGLLVSDLAARARDRAREAEQREREAALLAEVSTALLSGGGVVAELPRITEATARLLDLPLSRIELDDRAAPHEGEQAVELRAGDRRIGTLYLDAGAELNSSARRRFLPALASLLAIAVDRERFAHEALEAEALRRSDSLNTALLRTVSHDLRSPLTAIRASLEGLESFDLTLDSEDRKRLLATAVAETERLNRIVGNLLDLARLQAGAARSEPRLVTIEGLLDQALAQIAGGRRLDVFIPTDPPLVSVDPAQLERAFVNLLENALKFSPADSRVTVDVETTADEVIVRIADRGPGLSDRELETVFEPFRRASTTQGGPSTGLGLAIAKGFVEANGGRIWAEARPGGGASFGLALPAVVDSTRTSMSVANARTGA